MDKRIVIAAAGAGKTYYIANNFEKDERVILISFTNANVNNIRKEVQKRFNGKIPDNVQIMTFDSFVYNNLLKPVEPLISSRRSTGVDIRSIPIEDTRNPHYVKVNDISHYMNINNEYYVNRVGKLFLRFNKDIQKLVNNRLEKYCDAIYFDEFQDYNGFDFKVLKYFLEKSKLNVIAVGDIYQSCLTPLRNIGNPIAKSPFYKISTVDDLKKKVSGKVEFDETTLQKSRRVPKVICNIIQKKIGIDIQSLSKEEASIIHLTNVEDIHKIVSDSNIPKLVWNKSSIHHKGKNYVNWSYSKGDTYSQSCIILTGTTSSSDNWLNITSQKTRNGLYVALTRSKGDVYIITNNDYKKWRRYADKS
ncbi:UvrD-helicase domain-containing protein [Jeotgalicoccus sp. S0W5]|uniref:UvrD-helicase domain-containing protein n=1 Tax=Jeotgalicoccus sp. S0W5 TaxID=2527874 RepID=UPI001415102C|nr:UvrD-helicase domain-containing protein [Jeotgalicoccus sp. S0W5]